ncbi:MAG TPA: DUF2934 domain-containing protein [Steroidobacteraceae bacterium]|nr:DUF2934 domain-containing protein [Steroidobacteraceae bacterium]
MATRRSTASPRTAEPRTASPRTAEPLTSVGSGETPRRGASGASTVSAETRPTQRRAAAPKGQPEPAAAAPVVVSTDTRRAMIAKAAYLRSERRGFAPGFEEDDWLTAEKEVDALLSAGQSVPQ